jgi:hypothetical protein
VRLVREEDERTVIVMASVDGLGELYIELSARLGAPLAPPPAHITLSTRPGGAAIGVHDERELRADAAAHRPRRGRRAEHDRLGVAPGRAPRNASRR